MNEYWAPEEKPETLEVYSGWVVVTYRREWNLDKTLCSNWKHYKVRKHTNSRGRNPYVYSSKGKARLAHRVQLGQSQFYPKIDEDKLPKWQDYQGRNYQDYYKDYAKARDENIIGWYEVESKILPAKIVAEV